MKEFKTITINGVTYAVTDPDAATIEDTSIGAAAWSSKNIVDKLCPSFTESGAIVTCEPVEGYPLEVVADAEATAITRCGKNLFDKSESKLRTLSYITSGGDKVDIFGFEFMLPPGTYVLKAQSKELAKEGYIYGLTYDINGAYLGEWNAAWGTDLTAKTKTFTNWARVIIYDAINRPAAGAYMSYAWATFQKWDIQLEEGSTATAFEAYCGETFAPGETVPALSDINTIYADAGTVTVTGRADPNAINRKTAERLAALEAALVNT